MDKIVFTGNQAFEFYFKHNGIRISISTDSRTIYFRTIGNKSGSYLIEPFGATHRDLIDILDVAEKSRDFKDFRIRTGLTVTDDDWQQTIFPYNDTRWNQLKRDAKALYYRLTTPTPEIPKEEPEETNEPPTLEEMSGLAELKKQLKNKS